MSVINEVLEERWRQISKGHSEKSDDMNTEVGWILFMQVRLIDAASQAISGTIKSEYRRRLVQVAAMAIAAVESWDRKHGKN